MHCFGYQIPCRVQAFAFQNSSGSLRLSLQLLKVFVMCHPKLEHYICWLWENDYAIKQNPVLIEGMLFLKVWATFTNMTVGKSTGFLQGLSSASWHDPQERVIDISEDGYSGVQVRVTPMRMEIIIRATRTQNALGEKRRRIRELILVVQKRDIMKLWNFQI